MEAMSTTFVNAATMAWRARLAGVAAESEGSPIQLHGKARGYRLQTLPHPTTDLTNAMEELTALFEERSVKRLAQRRISLEDAAHLRGYDTIARALRHFPDLPSADAFARLVAQLKQQPPTTARALLDQLGSLCKDPALQAVLLQALCLKHPATTVLYTTRPALSLRAAQPITVVLFATPPDITYMECHFKTFSVIESVCESN